MKSILIAATAVGAAIAGLILYSGKKLARTRRSKAALGDGFNTGGNDANQMERNAMHSMG